MASIASPESEGTRAQGVAVRFLPSGLPICTCEPGQMVRTSKNHSYKATVCPNVHVWINSRDLWIGPGAQAAAGERLCAPLLTAFGRSSRDYLEYRNREYLSLRIITVQTHCIADTMPLGEGIHRGSRDFVRKGADRIGSRCGLLSF